MAKPQILIAEDRARTGSGVLKQMRREGYVPSVIYGGGIENKNVKVNAKTFRDMLNNSASDNILVNLDIEGAGTQLAFLQDVQHDAVTREIVHVDFLAVSETTSITASLPIELEGEPEGVQAGGQLEQLLYSLEIICLPKDLPESITVDVSALEIGESVNIGEIVLPEGVTPTLNADVLVALVAKARVATTEELAEDEAAAEAAEEPEVTSEKAPAE